MGIILINNSFLLKKCSNSPSNITVLSYYPNMIKCYSKISIQQWTIFFGIILNKIKILDQKIEKIFNIKYGKLSDIKHY